MNPRILAAVILLVVSLIVLLIGYRIGFRKQLSLIAGLDVSEVRDSDGLAPWIGTGLLSIGVLDLLISLALFAVSDRTPLLIVAYATVSLVGAVVLLIRMRRYLPNRGVVIIPRHEFRPYPWRLSQPWETGAANAWRHSSYSPSFGEMPGVQAGFAATR